MAYTNINKLTTIYIVQEYYLQERKRGVTAKRIKDNISLVYPMSTTTFYNYLACNVRAELRKLNTNFNELNKTKDHVIRTISEIEREAYGYQFSEKN